MGEYGDSRFKDSALIEESKEWRRFLKILIRMEWPSAWTWPFWSMPGVCRYTQDFQAVLDRWSQYGGVSDQQRTFSPLNCEILEEAWTGKEVNLSHLRTFGYIFYVHIELDRMSKLDPKSKRCIFIGYGISEYGYQFWDPKNWKIFRHKDVVFNEKKVYKALLVERSTP